MSHTRRFAVLVLVTCAFAATVYAAEMAAQGDAAAERAIEDDFHDPPRDARTRCYWWWLNGNVTKAAISRDLEQMREKGFGGALIFDADG